MSGSPIRGCNLWELIKKRKVYCIHNKYSSNPEMRPTERGKNIEYSAALDNDATGHSNDSK